MFVVVNPPNKINKLNLYLGFKLRLLRLVVRGPRGSSGEGDEGKGMDEFCMFLKDGVGQQSHGLHEVRKAHRPQMSKEMRQLINDEHAVSHKPPKYS